MLKKTGFFVLFALMAAAMVYAADSNTDKTGAAATTEISGVITAIDVSAKTISVRVDGSGNDATAKNFSFSGSTSFSAEMSNKKSVHADDLKAGDKVKMTIDSNNVATKIVLQSPTSTTGA